VCLEDGDQVEAELEGSALPFDGILMDITMSRTDGVDVCRNLREKLGVRVPIIAMTGSASSVDKKRYYKQGFDVVLPKPFTLETMRQALQEASERRANARFAYRGGMPEISSSDFSPAPV
jgi:CheY-like chemotaxis protein